MTNQGIKMNNSSLTVSGKVLNALAFPAFGLSILFCVIQMMLGNYGSLNFVLVGFCGGGILWALLSILYIFIKVLSAKIKR